MRQWIVMNEKDNVATALVDLDASLTLEINGEHLALKESIPFGHKFAIRDIAKGEDIYKYGQVIGRATDPIPSGSYAHVHNIESLRGRGDLAVGGGTA